jgi:hypothetical protein
MHHVPQRPAWQSQLNHLIEQPGISAEHVRDFLLALPEDRRRAVVNATNDKGWTPLRAAVSTRADQDAAEIVRVLLECEADPLIGKQVKDDINPVQEACRLGKIDLVRIMCLSCPESASTCTTVWKMYPVHYAAESMIAANRIQLLNFLMQFDHVDIRALTAERNSDERRLLAVDDWIRTVTRILNHRVGSNWLLSSLSDSRLPACQPEGP